mgnify:CR=1 FL=1
MINNIIDCWTNQCDEYDLEDKKIFKDFCETYNIDNDDSNIQFYMQRTLSMFHDKKDEYEITGFVINDYQVFIVKDVKGMTDGLYFMKRKAFDLFFDNLQSTLKLDVIMDSVDNGIKPEDYYIGLFQNKYLDYVNENNIFYLTVDDFIKEFSPSKYYDKNIVWSMYLKICNDNSVNLSNNEDINHHSNSLHTVNGFWRNQPYGSRSNPTYKLKWVDSFERGGKKVEETV